MTGKQAEKLARKLEIHLRRNQFSICQQIISHLEETYTGEEGVNNGRTAIAEVVKDPRLANLIEKVGVIYVDQVTKKTVKDLEELKMLGAKGMEAFRSAMHTAGVKV